MNNLAFRYLKPSLPKNQMIIPCNHRPYPYFLCFVYAICMSCLQEITNLILATDMARHKDIVEEFKSEL
jgi:hypothetical protein